MLARFAFDARGWGGAAAGVEHGIDELEHAAPTQRGNSVIRVRRLQRVCRLLAEALRRRGEFGSEAGVKRGCCIPFSHIGLKGRLMAISIKDPETDRLARALSAATGQSITEAIRRAIEERMERERHRPHRQSLADGIRRIQERVAALPVLDSRSADEILGYDANGLPA